MKRDANFNPAGFRYDAETGKIYDGTRLAGSTGGRYQIVKRGNNKSFAHRLAWRLHYGEWPNGEIDHINGDKWDNRIANLRLATRSENVCNAGCQKNSSSKLRGVHFLKNCSRWSVKVKKGDVLVFATASHSISAVIASRLIRRVLHGEFAHEARQDTQLRQHASLNHARAVADFYQD